MSDLRQALEYEAGELVDHPGGDVEAIIRAAARRFLALTETGPDYEAAEQAFAEWADDTDPEKATRRIVDAALADYLTEEET